MIKVGAIFGTTPMAENRFFPISLTFTDSKRLRGICNLYPEQEKSCVRTQSITFKDDEIYLNALEHVRRVKESGCRLIPPPSITPTVEELQNPAKNLAYRSEAFYDILWVSETMSESTIPRTVCVNALSQVVPATTTSESLEENTLSYPERLERLENQSRVHEAELKGVSSLARVCFREIQTASENAMNLRAEKIEEKNNEVIDTLTKQLRQENDLAIMRSNAHLEELRDLKTAWSNALDKALEDMKNKVTVGVESLISSAVSHTGENTENTNHATIASPSVEATSSTGSNDRGFSNKSWSTSTLPLETKVMVRSLLSALNTKRYVGSVYLTLGGVYICLRCHCRPTWKYQNREFTFTAKELQRTFRTHMAMTKKAPRFFCPHCLMKSVDSRGRIKTETNVKCVFVGQFWYRLMNERCESPTLSYPVPVFKSTFNGFTFSRECVFAIGQTCSHEALQTLQVWSLALGNFSKNVCHFVITTTGCFRWKSASEHPKLLELPYGQKALSWYGKYYKIRDVCLVVEPHAHDDTDCETDVDDNVSVEFNKRKSVSNTGPNADTDNNAKKPRIEVSNDDI